jgi:hypothetical protein
VAKRIAISNAQAQSGAAAELVALLQSVTSDGRISSDEIKELHRWLQRNRDTGLPGIELLAMTIETIAADGRVTDAERTELAKVIERVLPPELREFAKQRRKLESLAKKERDRLTQDAVAEARAQEAAKFEPICAFDFVVAGVGYEGRSAVTAHMVADEPVFLIRDRRNGHSPNAIEVRTQEGYQIGFVPESDAVELAPLFDQGYKHIAFVKRIWQGRSFPVPVVIAEIFPPNTARTQAIAEHQVPQKRAPRPRTRTNYLIAFILMLLIVVLWVGSCVSRYIG